MKKVFIKGLTTGIILQLAIGPIFIFVVNITFQKGILNALSAVLAVTIVDYIYILLAVIGVGKILEKEKIKKTFTIISSLVLLIFGIVILKKSFYFNTTNQIILESGIFKSFLSAFTLTILNPLTIIFWTSIFSTKTVEYNLNKKELVIFGLSSGLATLLFLSLSVISLSFIRVMISKEIIQILNVFVGILLILYSFLRTIKTIKV
ncbi:MAG: LysE family transporter [Fusobacteriaceae bacterium]|nr:LysE family transporter [Fusobacteriaceae bacterium]